MLAFYCWLSAPGKCTSLSPIPSRCWSCHHHCQSCLQFAHVCGSHRYRLRCLKSWYWCSTIWMVTRLCLSCVALIAHVPQAKSADCIHTNEVDFVQLWPTQVLICQGQQRPCMLCLYMSTVKVLASVATRRAKCQSFATCTWCQLSSAKRFRCFLACDAVKCHLAATEGQIV